MNIDARKLGSSQIIIICYNMLVEHIFRCIFFSEISLIPTMSCELINTTNNHYSRLQTTTTKILQAKVNKNLDIKTKYIKQNVLILFAADIKWWLILLLYCHVNLNVTLLCLSQPFTAIVPFKKVKPHFYFSQIFGMHDLNSTFEQFEISFENQPRYGYGIFDGVDFEYFIYFTHNCSCKSPQWLWSWSHLIY